MKKEIKDNLLIYLLLGIILIGSLFVRVYRIGDLLHFYYDQGRDALVIWKLWHHKDIFLVGPVTGLAGIFLGPFYYYLIAPLYLVGGGNPVYPAVFLAVLATIAVYLVYYLGWKFHSRQTGLIAAIIAGFSYFIVLTSRWLANPNPILLASILLFLSMWKITEGKSKKWWIAIFFLVGLSLQLEAASAVFYLPILLVFIIWQKGRLPKGKILLISLCLFLSTFIPQIVFNFIHGNILFNNLKKVLLEEKSFRLNFWDVLDKRIEFFWSVFYLKILPGWKIFAASFSLMSFSALIVKRKKLKKYKNILTLFAIFFIIPAIGYLLFQGNYGNIYDYYLAGYYLPLILLFSLGLGLLWQTKAGKFAVLSFFFFFLTLNGVLLKNYLVADIDGPTHISLGNQLQAVNWVFEDANGRGEFNVDSYVPPVIPYAYDYLFLWQGTKRCGKSLCQLKLKKRVGLLYTLYEVDPPHPERLEAWLKRQEGIGKVEEEVRFGGITVQRRKRL
jgi:4-amino-4-deoxy-L-arabinose transferase-like glycosyltransferase